MEITEQDKRDLLVLAAADLLVYCEMINPRYQDARHLRYLTQILHQAEQRKITRLAIEMPPQHGKSWTVSQHFPAWYLGRHPEHSVITGAYNETKALDFGLSVKDQVNDPLYRAMFPALVVRRDSNSALKFTTTQGGSYYAVGRGGSATGRRADLFVVDDPYKDQEEAHSEAVRRQIRNWWDKVIYTRLAPGAIVIVIHTRWDEDDMIGWLLKEHAAENWTRIRLPALAEENDPLGRHVGEPLWPERYPLDELEKRRVNDPLGFEALYQQHPVGAGARMFKREWIEAADVNCRFDPIKNPPRHRVMPKLMLVDPANSKKASADYTTIWVLGLGADRRFWVLDMLRDRLNLTERGDAVFRLHRKWMQSRIPQSWVFYEQYGLQADIAYLNDRMARENYRFLIHAVGGTMAKCDRISRLVGPIEQGHYMIPLYHRVTNLAGVEEDLIKIFIEQEYALYLSGGEGATHDDMLDCLARSQDPDVEARIVWPRGDSAGDPNDALRKYREQQRAQGRTWASA